MAQTVEKVYATALFELCKEQNTLDESFDELKALRQIFDDNGELLKLLASPIISDDEKHGIIDSVFLNRVSKSTYNFLCVLSDKGRAMYFDKIADEFHRLYNESRGIIEVSVITSQPLSEELEGKLKAKLEGSTGKSVVINKSVDESILGGVIVRYNDREIDGSVKKRLADMRKSIDSIIA